MKKLTVSDGVKRHLKQEFGVDIKGIEDQPSRQRKRAIKREIMKKFKRKGNEK